MPGTLNQLVSRRTEEKKSVLGSIHDSNRPKRDFPKNNQVSALPATLFEIEFSLKLSAEREGSFCITLHVDQ